jgi:hypothetical protein
MGRIFSTIGLSIMIMIVFIAVILVVFGFGAALYAFFVWDFHKFTGAFNSLNPAYSLFTRIVLFIVAIVSARLSWVLTEITD